VEENPTRRGGDPSTLPVWKKTQCGGAEPLRVVSCGWKHNGKGKPLLVASVWKETRWERGTPLVASSCKENTTGEGFPPLVASLVAADNHRPQNELCACFRGQWSGGGGSSIYHPQKQASELVFEGGGWWGTCLMVSNTKRKRNIAGVPCTPTPRVPFLLAFSLFAFEVAACQWPWSARLLIIPCTNNTQRFVNDKQKHI